MVCWGKEGGGLVEWFLCESWRTVLAASCRAVISVVQDRVGFVKLRYASLAAFINGTIVGFRWESPKHPRDDPPQLCVSGRRLAPFSPSSSSPPNAIRRK